MTPKNYPVNNYNDYHAHVYFEQETLAFATDLCEKAGERFGFTVGDIIQRPIGPHPKWSCQIMFTANDFEQFIPWLDENRDGLTVLVHGVTGDHLKDHTDHAYWLGKSETLNLEMFKR